MSAKSQGPESRGKTNDASLLRQIPSVEEVLQLPALEELSSRVGRRFVAERVREVLSEIRQQILSDAWMTPLTMEVVEKKVTRAVERAMAYSLQPVINATGVILHTNLGRAPLSRKTMEHVMEVATQYSTLEYDLVTGQRGQRDAHVVKPLQELLGADNAIVVNNNAAAVLLVLNSLADGGEVVVSRGELIEIGGSFRIPEIMEKSGAILREVGTTNRTRISDYRDGITDRTRLLLRVHPSNFHMVGFTEKPSLGELVELGRDAGIPVYEDMGSGCLISMAEQGIRDEIPAKESLAAGVDVISFSGDKMLGGPQAGMIAGSAELVRQIRRNPMFRALRVDKLTFAALETTFQAYLQEQYDRIPVLRMIRMRPEEIEERAGRLMAICQFDTTSPLQWEMVAGESVIGGGSAPGNTIPTKLLALQHDQLSAAALEQRLVGGKPPVVARVEDNQLLLDLRTVLPEQEPALAKALSKLAKRLPDAAVS